MALDRLHMGPSGPRPALARRARYARDEDPDALPPFGVDHPAPALALAPVAAPPARPARWRPPLELTARQPWRLGWRHVALTTGLAMAAAVALHAWRPDVVAERRWAAEAELRAAAVAIGYEVQLEKVRAMAATDDPVRTACLLARALGEAPAGGAECPTSEAVR